MIWSGKSINDGVWMAHSTLMALMGYTGKEITWDQAMNSQLKLVPDHLAWDTDFPIRPMAQPGRTEFV